MNHWFDRGLLHSGRVAQLVEQCPFKAWVAGSSPAALTSLFQFLSSPRSRLFLRRCGLPQLFRSLFRDPFIGAGLEQVERKGSAIEHLVVELANVEPGAQFLLRAFPEFADLELAQLIA